MVTGPEITRYAALAAAHIISRISDSDMKSLKSVILFGSAARMAAVEDSDVDLFFDVNLPSSAQKALRARLNRAAEEFYSSNTGLEYKLKGTSNEIRITVGRLDEWQDLSQSIAANGIILYGRHAAEPQGLKAYTVFSWSNPGKAKGAILNRIYGYKVHGKQYSGLLERAEGRKLGRATIMVPAGSRNLFISIFEKHGVNYSQYEMWG